MSLDLPALRAAVAAQGTVVRILVVDAAGSAPRGAGTSMLVWRGGSAGTIGGGALEWQAMAEAEAMLAPDAPAQRTRRLPLGPDLGQCCGGAVHLVWERFAAATLPDRLPWARPLGPSLSDGAVEDLSPPPAVLARAAALRPGARPVRLQGWLIEAAPAPAQPVWLHGAGHVGRAMAVVLAPLPDLALTWIDIDADRFPPEIPAGVTRRIAPSPEEAVEGAPPGALHLVLTHSHARDLALCHLLLREGSARIGLIGSATKAARFRARLTALGHGPEALAALTCPIGDPALGKHPQAIAIGVAAALLSGRLGAKAEAALAARTGT